MMWENFFRVAGATFICLSGGGCAGNQAPLSSSLGEAGYTRILSPRDSVQPGTVVTLTSRRSGTVVDILCYQQQAFPELVPVSGTTEEFQNEDVQQHRYTLEPSYTEALRAKVGLEKATAISVTLSNTSVVEVALADLVGLEDKRQEKCKKIVERTLDSDKGVYVVTKVLKGDLQYTVSGNAWTGLDADAKLQKLTALGAELQANTLSQNSQSVSGVGLPLGIYVERLGRAGDALRFQGTAKKGELVPIALSEAARSKVTSEVTVLENDLSK